MKKLLLATTMFAAITMTANAQRMMGVSTSNWGATTGLELNPANIADSRTRFSLELFGLNFGVDNNLASVDLSKATGATSGGGLGGGGLLTFSNNAKFNIMMPYAEIRLPGAMYTIDHKNAVALTMRVRGFNQFNNFDKTLFQSVMDPLASSGAGYNFTSKDFNWTAQMWSEINLSYGRVVYEKGEHFVKVGATVGRMSGIGFLSVNGKNLDAQFYTNDSLVATNTDIQFASSVLDSAGKLGSGLSDVSLFGKGGTGGGGFRADLGAVYEYRPDKFDANDHSANKYRVRGSIALTDLGRIKYNSAVGVRAYGNGTMSASDLAQNITNYSSLKDYMHSRGFFLDTGKKVTKVGIPTALVLGVDYYIWGHFYANATWIKNMANRGKFGNSYYGQLTITPRFDTKIFTFALPLTYSAMTKGIKAGLGVRLGGLYFGSDDMLLFVSNKAYGVNFYMGGYIPINRKYKHHKSDSKTDSAAPAPADAAPKTDDKK